MKRKITITLLVVACFLFNSTTKAQWTLTGLNDIYNNNSSGKVGIGTTTPSYPLQIGNLPSAGSLSSGGNVLVGLSIDAVGIAGSQSVNKHAIFGCINTNKDIIFPTYNGSSFDERMRIEYTGFVGIGATSPLGLLHLGTASGVGANIYVQSNGGGPVHGLWFGNQLSTSGSGKYAGLKVDITNDKFYIMDYSATAGTAVERMTFDINGNVGIGTTTPGAKLDVAAVIANGIAVRGVNSSGSGNKYGGYFEANGGGTINIGLMATASGATSNYSMYLNGPSSGPNNYALYCSATARSYFADTLGIGTTTPLRLFHVQGQMRTTNDSPEKPNAGSWTGFSDQRLKQNITPFVDGLEILRHINPVTFKFNGLGELSSTETHIGVIAQDIKLVAPYCVGVGTGRLVVKQSESTNFNTTEIIETLPPDSLGEVHTIVSPLTFNYDGLIYVMINSIKKLDSTNIELLKNDSILTKKDSIKDAEILALQNLTTLYNTKFQQMQNQLNQLDSMINSCCSLGSTRSRHLNSDSQISDTQVINSKNVELEDRQVIVLFQNNPNPFKEQTTLEYYLPDNVQRAQIIFFEQSGKLIKTIDLTEKGKGVLNVFSSDLSNGTYLYSLIVDGQTVETKKMVKN
jgi:hypothetical protein